MQDLSDPRLQEVVRRLVHAYEPERIYLFGSHARGDADPDSDYDLLLIVPDDAPPERRRARLAYEVLWGTGTAADVLVWTRSGFLAWHDQPFRKTHNLVELGEAAARITATSAARRACSCRLSTWSLRWRSVHLDDRPPGLPRPRS